MVYQINIQDKQAYEWLKKLIENTLNSPSSRPYQTSYEQLVHWDNAFKQCDNLREEAAATRKQNTSKTPAVRKTAVKKSVAKRKPKEISDFDCVDHPTYGGIRVPRTDCKKCWSIYKKLHPMEYDRALRKFRLKQRQNEK